MEFQVNKEKICINETVFDGELEQSIELDYMLPDYCPNIFKILQSRMEVKISNSQVDGRKLTIDGTAYLHVLYLGEESGRMRQLEQKQPFTKTAELKEECTGAVVTVVPRCDHFHCRAVNSRRLDMRGAVTLKTTVFRPKQVEAVTGCSHLQVHRREWECCGTPMVARKDFTIQEDLMIEQGKPPIQDVIHYEATAFVEECKLLSNKAVCKGQLHLHTLYLCSDHPEQPEVMEHVLPISQIVDMDGLDEECQCSVSLEVVRYDMDLQIEDDGECRSFHADVGIRAVCQAGKNKRIAVADDGYSIGYEMESETQTVKLQKICQPINQTVMTKAVVPTEGASLSGIYDLICEINGVGWECRTGRLNLTCMMPVTVIAGDEEGKPVSIHRAIPLEAELCSITEEKTFLFQPHVQIESISYHMGVGKEIELRISLSVTGMLYETEEMPLMTNVKVLEDHPKTRKNDCTLLLYYADAGENIWEIAKRYSTSVNAILEENALEQEVIPARGMVLIPIIDE